MPKHIHTWVPLIPPLKTVDPQRVADYWVEAFLKLRINDGVYCPGCCKSGHKIKSNRGGVRVHASGYFIQKANEIREKYEFPILETNEQIKNHE